MFGRVSRMEYLLYAAAACALSFLLFTVYLAFGGLEEEENNDVTWGDDD